jgi:hypothetical protein
VTTIAQKSRLPRPLVHLLPARHGSALGPPPSKHSNQKAETTRPEAQHSGPPVSRRAGLQAVAVLVDKNIFTGHEGARAPVVSARDALRLTATRCEERMCSAARRIKNLVTLTLRVRGGLVFLAPPPPR